MPRRILVVQGHPDPAGGHLCHALADAYAEGAAAGGHEVRRVEVARLDFPLLRTAAGFQQPEPPPALVDAMAGIVWCDHLVLVYPLWLGSLPALLKGFLEQVFRPGVAFDLGGGSPWQRRLKGRSARVVVTMGMPVLVYRWWFGAHSLRSLERNILGFCGFAPIRESLFGMVEAAGDARRRGWLDHMRGLGRRGR